MNRVLILTDFESDGEGNFIAHSAELDQMIQALEQAIAHDAQSHTVQVVSPEVAMAQLQQGHNPILCPLTLDLPRELAFPERALYQTCRNLAGLRQWVEQKLGFLSGAGDHWLPVVLTAKGSLYGEVIGTGAASLGLGVSPLGSQRENLPVPYYQPLHLPDRLRQPLYHLGGTLLQSLSATPAAYLLQFGFHDGEKIVFDRLLPFPAVPAIASIGIQSPDLFTCHWRCLTRQPVLDLAIVGSMHYRTYET